MERKDITGAQTLTVLLFVVAAGLVAKAIWVAPVESWVKYFSMGMLLFVIGVVGNLEV